MYVYGHLSAIKDLLLLILYKSKHVIIQKDTMATNVYKDKIYKKLTSIGIYN